MALFQGLWRYGKDGKAEKLPPELREAILTYIGEPTLRRWQAIRGERVSRAVTLHDAVDSVDIGYPGFCPSGILVGRALRKRQEIETVVAGIR